MIHSYFSLEGLLNWLLKQNFKQPYQGKKDH